MGLSEKKGTVLRLLGEGHIPSRIAEMLGKSQQAVTKTVHSLERNGFISIKKISKNCNVYTLTSDGVKELQGIAPKGCTEKETEQEFLNRKWRVHKLEVAIRVPYALQPVWERFLNKAFEIKDLRPVQLNNNIQGLTNIENIPVKTTTKSVIFYPRDIYAPTKEEAGKILLETIIKLAYKINRKLGLTVYSEKYLNLEILDQQWAYMNDPIAKKYIEADMRATIRIDGEKRAIIDFSKRIPEFELVNKRWAQEDAATYEKFIGSLLSGDFNPTEIKERVASIGSLENHLFRQTEIMDKYAVNIEMHLGVMQEIKDGLRKLGLTIQDKAITVKKQIRKEETQASLSKFLGT